jgi:hypothetical protein
MLAVCSSLFAFNTTIRFTLGQGNPHHVTDVQRISTLDDYLIGHLVRNTVAAIEHSQWTQRIQAATLMAEPFLKLIQSTQETAL